MRKEMEKEKIALIFSKPVTITNLFYGLFPL